MLSIGMLAAEAKTGRCVFSKTVGSTIGAVLVLNVLFACSSGSKDKLGDVANNCPAVGDLTVEFVQPAFSTNVLCQLSGTLTSNAVLAAGVDWRLDGIVQVGDANSNPVLVIEPGATLKGNIEGTLTEYLYLVPGASLQAVGTPASPIIFSSNDDDYALDVVNPVGEWGGLVLEDNLATTSSIRLEYVIIAEAGAPVDINGTSFAANLTLQGEHADSRLRYVQSHASANDGMRLGAASGSNLARLEWLLVTASNRDGLQLDNFAGLLKDLLVIHNTGFYSDASQAGGRAGLRIGGSNTDSSAAPLVVNATLVGRDNSSEAPGVSSAEFGLVFENQASAARLANIALVNFRHGCYEIGGDVDLSGMALNADPLTDTSFVDGVHCVNENTGDDLLGFVRAGGVDIPGALQGFNSNGDGLRGYSSGNNVLFAGESGSASTFTASWYIEGIAGLDNASTDLKRYNNGDTDASGTANASDENFQPLFNADTNSADPLFAGVLGSSAAFGGFNLPTIGAVRAGTAGLASQFDDWTLQDGAVEPALNGFLP